MGKPERGLLPDQCIYYLSYQRVGNYDLHIMVFVNKLLMGDIIKPTPPVIVRSRCKPSSAAAAPGGPTMTSCNICDG